MKLDVLVVGGGPAGLSAALILGRCHRNVLLCDEGHQRNLSSHAIHGLLGREGRSPSDFLMKCGKSCPATSLFPCAVHGLPRSRRRREFGLSVLTARPVPLRNPPCDGLVDELPELAGIEPLYGVSVHHCLYCDGFEYAGKPVAAYGRGTRARSSPS